MNNLSLEVFSQLCSRLDDSSIRRISCISNTYRSLISSMKNSEIFWYLRACLLANVNLQPRFNVGWKRVYQTLDLFLRERTEAYEILMDTMMRMPMMNILLEAKFNPPLDLKASVMVASRLGYTDTVRFLLTNNIGDPSYSDSYALAEAVQEGHIDVVRLLLEDKRIDPSARNNMALRGAVERKHIEIENLLRSRIRREEKMNFS